MKKIILLIITTYFLYIQIVFSQGITVNVYGKVTDEKGPGISGASVNFTSLLTENIIQAKTDDEGFFIQ